MEKWYWWQNFNLQILKNLLWVEVFKFTFIFLRVLTKDQGNLWVHMIPISYNLNAVHNSMERKLPFIYHVSKCGCKLAHQFPFLVTTEIQSLMLSINLKLPGNCGLVLSGNFCYNPT